MILLFTNHKASAIGELDIIFGKFGLVKLGRKVPIVDHLSCVDEAVSHCISYKPNIGCPPFPTYPGHLPSFPSDSLPVGGKQHKITPIHQQVQTFQVHRCNHAICDISNAARFFDIASSPDSNSGCNGESLQILCDATTYQNS